MKRFIFILSLTLLISSCGTSDKKAQLEKLKNEREQLDKQIKELELALNLDSNSSNKTKKMVSLDTAKLETFTTYIELQGKLDGEENVIATAQTPGVITHIYVEVGQSVKKGQVLAEIDATILKQSIAEIKTQLDYATTMYEKQKSLWEQNIGSEVQYLGSKTQKESMEKRLATLMEQIEMSKIKSPINGTIEELPVKIGQSVAPGMVVFRVINFSKAKVVLDVSETYASKIKNGDKAIVYFPDFAQETEARISFASKYINPNNRSFIAEIRLGSMSFPLRANMIAVVKINDYTKEKTITVPVNILQEGLNETYIMVAEKSGANYVAKKRIITTGVAYGGKIEVLSGIEENDLIIKIGYQNLNDNEIIQVK